MKRSRRPLRLFEIVLWVAGITLLGAASAATFDRWHYQTQQERALFERGPAVAQLAIESPPQNVAAPLETQHPQPERESVPMPQPDREATVEKKPARLPAPDPGVIGRLEIPRLGIKAIVKEGDDDRTLARAVGWLPGSARLGERGNAVLAGHRDTFFRRLEAVETNDRIRFTIPGGSYEYRVDSVRVVPPEETSVLQSRGVEEITLVTCYPFRYVGTAPDRFIVRAVRVQ